MVKERIMKKTTGIGWVWNKGLLCAGAAILAAGLTGCGGWQPLAGTKEAAGGSVQEADMPDNVTAAVQGKPQTDQMADQTKTEAPPAGGGADMDAAGEIVYKGNGVNGFALAMGNRLYQENEGENFVCSPVSLWLPMAALLNAADEGSLDEAAASMGLGGLTAEEINEMTREMLARLSRKEETAVPELQIANVIFVDKKYTVAPAFEKAFSDYYEGAAMAVDFESGKALETINNWASEHTNGEIPRVLEALDPNTAAAIANAVYFSDRWSFEFSQENTRTDIFHSAEGDVETEFMNLEKNGLGYYEDERFQAVRLDFIRGARLYVLLPEDGDAGRLYGSLTARDLEAVSREADDGAQVTLALPKFEIEGVMDLQGFLSGIGSPYVDAGRGPLTGLVEDADPLYVSQALQKARIRVDEKGTTAAAVTIMAMKEMGLEIPGSAREIEMICDKPFVFLLTKDTNVCKNQILFSGVVNCP